MSEKFKPLKSVEGYILFCRNINEDATEEEIDDLFNIYGIVKNLQLDLNRKTGNIKGYALIEYETLAEAEDAIKNLNDTDFMGQKIKVDFLGLKVYVNSEITFTSK